MKVPRACVRWLALTVISGLVAVAGTWPLAAHLSTRLYDPTGEGGGLASLLLPDVYLTVWILAWDARALLGRPAAIFDANIFHPARHVLALSEHMLGAMPVYLPIASVSRDPVLAHQMTLVVSFALAFLSMAILLRCWTRSSAAAVVAGGLFALGGFRLGNLAALHIEGNYYLPLVPLLAQRSTVDGRVRWPLALTVVLVLQGLCSYYLAYAMFAATAAILLVAFIGDARARRSWTRLVGPVLCAGGIIAVVSLPYVWLSSARVIDPPALEVVGYSSATLAQTGATMAVVLAVATIWWWRTGLRTGIPSAWMLALLVSAVAAHLIALGPLPLGVSRLPAPYTVLAAAVPGFDKIRVPVRFNVVTAFGFSALAGFGVAGVSRSLEARGRVRERRGWIALGAAIVLVVVLTATRVAAPVPTVAVVTRENLPAAYEWLADAPAGPLLEIPFEDVTEQPLERLVEARRMYLSVYHWHPILNGYSGYVPRSYEIVSGMVRALPDRRALKLLIQSTGVRYVLVHGDQLASDEARRWLVQRDRFEAMRVFGGDVVFIAPGAGRDRLVERLRDTGDKDRTLTGTRLRVLPLEARGANVDVAGARSARAIAGIAFDIPVRVTNVGTARWPVLAPPSDDVVELASRWEDGTGRAVAQGRSPLPYDLPPAREVLTAMTVSPPRSSGRFRLVLGVAQGATWFPGETASLEIELQQ